MVTGQIDQPYTLITDQQYRCLVCDDTMPYKLISVKKIFYGNVVRRECPAGHLTVEHVTREPLLMDRLHRG